MPRPRHRAAGRCPTRATAPAAVRAAAPAVRRAAEAPEADREATPPYRPERAATMRRPTRRALRIRRRATTRRGVRRRTPTRHRRMTTGRAPPGTTRPRAMTPAAQTMLDRTPTRARHHRKPAPTPSPPPAMDRWMRGMARGTPRAVSRTSRAFRPTASTEARCALAEFNRAWRPATPSMGSHAAQLRAGRSALQALAPARPGAIFAAASASAMSIRTTVARHAPPARPRPGARRRASCGRALACCAARAAAVWTAQRAAIPAIVVGSAAAAQTATAAAPTVTCASTPATPPIAARRR